jgi:hypothetical protein
MASASAPVADYRGNILFRCSDCGRPLTHDDFFHLGLRMPEPDESRDDYHEAELLDSVRHEDCRRARQAG